MSQNREFCASVEQIVKCMCYSVFLFALATRNLRTTFLCSTLFVDPHHHPLPRFSPLIFSLYILLKCLKLIF